VFEYSFEWRRPATWVTVLVVLLPLVLVPAALGPHAAPARRGHSGVWTLKWSTNFSAPVALGQFSGCDDNADGPNPSCSDLPASLRSQWWAYPWPWPDTATQRGYPVGGYYDPRQTIWISSDQMHIRVFRAGSSVRSAAVVPKAAMGQLYGKYVETFRVSQIAPGYKSAHLLWPSGNADYEVDFPENEWDTSISAYVHAGGSQQSFDTNASWGTWHTTEIEWTPTRLSFFLDGKLIGTTTQGVPDVPMDWIIQNESALNGESAPLHSSAQIDIASVSIYAYTPGASAQR
jgi:hypothetical protein